MVLVDGIADYQIKWSDDKIQTTLQRAKTPILDALASQGIFGVHDPVQSGLACGSDTAHMSIFGYNPLKLYEGRGVFESLGAGMGIKVGDIAFKSNFSYRNEESKLVVRRRVDRAFPSWGKPLCEALNGIPIPGFPEHSVEVMYATEHRCGVKVMGPNLSHAISGNDPLKDNRAALNCEAINAGNANAEMTAQIINVLSSEFERVLSSNPICLERKA